MYIARISNMTHPGKEGDPRSINILIAMIMPPTNFEEIEEAYWFGPVRPSVRGSHFAYGHEPLEI